jgi:hypothetical protein
MFKRCLLLLELSAAFCPGSINGRILINEVMSNEPGGEVSLEWVELWNYSDSSASFSGLCFVDDDVVTALDSMAELPPDGFVVLARNPEKFEGHFGDGTGEWGDSGSERYCLLACRMSLRNDHDAVMIIDERGSVISHCRWTSVSPDGVSYERADPRQDDSSAVWQDCGAADGSTPGQRNSITPGYNDLELYATFFIEGAHRDQLSARMLVRNVGLSVSDSSALRLGVDHDGNRFLDESEILLRQQIPAVAPYDSVISSARRVFPTGPASVIASLSPDDNPSNNDTVATLRFGLQPFEIVINEILADPDSPLESEWIELHSVAEVEINLDQWSLCDGVGCALIEDVEIGAGSHVILCQDDVAFTAYYHDMAGAVVVAVRGWRTLNNAGDVIYLLDDAGLTVDSVLYGKGEGGNVSLERIDPHEVGYEMSNWYRSTSPAGSTPGRINSIRGGFSVESVVVIDARVMSPDGDGVDDILTIRYDLPRGSMLSLRVFDLNGMVVRTIFEDEYLSSGEYEYNGICDDGSRLEAGMYILLASVAGETEATKKMVFAVVGKR